MEEDKIIKRRGEETKIWLCVYLPARVASPVSLTAPSSTSTDMVPNRWEPSGRPMAPIASVTNTTPNVHMLGNMGGKRD